MKLNTISVVITLTGIISITIFFSKPVVEHKINLAKDKFALTFEVSKTDKKVFIDESTQFSATDKKSTEQQRDNKNTFGYKTLWSVIDKDKQKPFPFQNPRKIHYRYLKLNRNVISKLKQNDEINFFIPQLERNYYAVVSQIKLTDSGVNSYSGVLVNQNPHFNFSITQGPNTTYALINTPDGQFAIESHAGDAWINDIQDERKTLDYSEIDIIKLTPKLNSELLNE